MTLAFLFLVGSGSRLSCLRFDHALLELIDAPGGIDELLLTGVEGMAGVANADNDDRFGGTGLNHVATSATDFRVHILRMNLIFHKRLQTIPLHHPLTRRTFAGLTRIVCRGAFAPFSLASSLAGAGKSKKGPKTFVLGPIKLVAGAGFVPRHTGIMPHFAGFAILFGHTRL